MHCLYLIFYISNLWAYDLVFEESVVLEVSQEKAFYFAGDAKYDTLWRSEVHSIKTNSEFDLGTVYVEDAFLGVHYNYITKVEITALKPPHQAIYETTKDNLFKLKSQRSFKKINARSTLFTYKVFVEKELIYDIWKFKIPLKITEDGYSLLMKTYLQNLRTKIQGYIFVS